MTARIVLVCAALALAVAATPCERETYIYLRICSRADLAVKFPAQADEWQQQCDAAAALRESCIIAAEKAVLLNEAYEELLRRVYNEPAPPAARLRGGGDSFPPLRDLND